MSGDATYAYRRVAESSTGGGLVPQRFKQYPDRPRYPLPWPPAPEPQTTGNVAALLAAVMISYAPTRLRLATRAALLASFGGSGAGFPPLQHSVNRPVPSGGAYYPTELYAAVDGDNSLPGGVYHYDAVHHTLEQLTTGDPRPGLRRALGTEPGPCTILVTCRLWKNEPKYRAFGYRLGCADTGAMVGQLMSGGPRAARVQFLFGDAPLGDLLGLDPALEAVYAAIELVVEKPGGQQGGGQPPIGPIDAPSTGLMVDRARSAIGHPAVRRIHDASQRITAAGALGADLAPAAQSNGNRIDLPEPIVIELSAGVPGRRSAVKFSPEALSAAELGTVLHHATTGCRSDLPGTERASPVDAYCIVERVDGIAPGVYWYDPAVHALVPRAHQGPVRELLRAVRRDLDSGLWSAAACAYLFADLDGGLRAIGDRWYRIANLLGGIATQRACLAASAAGLACRPVLGFDGAAARRLVDRPAPPGVPAGRLDLMQLLLGRPATRPGIIDIDFWAARTGQERR
jgi:SagB-type dehydrogenase family enzyme